MSDRAWGMDVAAAREAVTALSAQVSALEGVLESIRLSRRVSVEPTAYGLVPHISLVIAATSFLLTQSAEAEVRGAIESARALISQLRTHIADQERVSAADAGPPRGVAGRADSLLSRLPPDASPEQVAQWWAGLTAGQQDRLAHERPEVIGNLDGIPFSARDRANRRSLGLLTAELRELEREANALVYEGDEAGYEALLADHGYDIDSFWDALATVSAVEATLADSRSSTPYSLIQFQSGMPPLAAIAVGDLDAATQVTVMVPGMGTTVADSMREWTMTASNLFFEQQRQARRELVEIPAVVAWIGYDAPLMATSPSTEVLSTRSAEAGADRLVSLLEGITAAREWGPGENLSVVAHSYGSTTASLALASTPAENYVMLGSAGLDPSTPTARDLQVPAARVWASEAAGDWVADLGRGYPSTHPIDPASAAFGARTFSAEDAVVDGQVWHGSDGHSASPQVAAQLEGEITDQYGYLDLYSTPLLNTAQATLGLTEGIVR